MSNLSNIGFGVESKEELLKLVEKTRTLGQLVKADKGIYFHYSDQSGAEFWTQYNKKKVLIGGNPHFSGKSRMKVCLTDLIYKSDSSLDGSFHALAEPSDDNDPDNAAYPFMFDSPDIRSIGQMELPTIMDIQLAAFPLEITLYESEESFFESHNNEIKFASKSFIPSGLFTGGGDNPGKPEALGVLTGIIKEWEKKTNVLTGNAFYWFLVETYGGEFDVVAAPLWVENEPKVGGVVQGQFWLSGRLINAPKYGPGTNGLIGRFFGN